MATTGSTAVTCAYSERAQGVRRRGREATMAIMIKGPNGVAAAAASERDDRRSHDRFDVEWAVDCVAEDTFLYAAITNISAMGIFVKTTDPLAIRTTLALE